MRLSIFGNPLILIAGCILLGGIFITIFQFFFNNNKDIVDWRGVVLGQATEAEVIELLGEPDNIVRCERWGAELDNPYNVEHGYLIQPCLFASLIYEYEQRSTPNKAPGVHQIHFRDGIVWLVIEDTFAYPYDEVILNEEVIATYGWPEEEMWTRRGRRRLLYCEQGVIVGINHEKMEVALYFKSISTIECIHEFQFYLTFDSPGMTLN